MAQLMSHKVCVEKVFRKNAVENGHVFGRLRLLTSHPEVSGPWQSPAVRGTRPENPENLTTPVAQLAQEADRRVADAPRIRRVRTFLNPSEESYITWSRKFSSIMQVSSGWASHQSVQPSHIPPIRLGSLKAR
jgi:hypothetical protein